MLILTDTAKISIIVTAFSTLIIMTTCVLYKLSKLRQVLERKPSEATNDLVTIGLPWRRESDEPAGSECSVCEEERGTRRSAIPGNQDLRQRALRNTAGQEDCVFTGRLTMDIEYEETSECLVFRHIASEDLLPWEYSSPVRTYVRIDFKSAEKSEQRRSDEADGLQKVCYQQELEFELTETDLNCGEMSVSVWATSGQPQDSLVGQCRICAETLVSKSTADRKLNISKNIYKRVSRKLEAEILLSLSYLPTAERLSVVVMKASNVEITTEESITRACTTIPNPFVKVCLIYAGRKIKKKKTSVKRHEKNPVYNESMIFDVPGDFLHKIGFLVTVEHRNFETEECIVLGRVVMGSPVHNNSLRHWNQMLAFPRRPVAAWHKVFYLG